MIEPPEIDVTKELPKYLNKCKFIPGSKVYQNAPPNKTLNAKLMINNTSEQDIDAAKFLQIIAIIKANPEKNIISIIRAIILIIINSIGGILNAT